MSKEEVKEAPDGTLEQGEFKVKKKPKKLNKKDEPIKVDLSKKEEPKKEEDAVPTQEASNSDVIIEEKKDEASSEEVVEEVRDAEEVKEEITVMNDNTEEVVEDIKEEVTEEKIEQPKVVLPENVDKLVEFMKDTGGTLEDYVKLNKDYSKLDNEEILIDYYARTKPYLNRDEVEDLLDDNFDWDDDEDEREVRRKQLALKEELAKAKGFLDTQKSKYYDELKLSNNVTPEQKKANDFFNRHNEQQELAKKRHNMFTESTKKFFNNDFEGFKFKLGEKQFNYKVNNVSDTANKQSDLNNFVGKFLDEKGQIKDFEGYHKALYAARNVDTLAQHFYEQGKSDAIKDVTAKSKNITTDERPSSGDVFINGMRVKAISGADSSKLTIKRKK